jgi:hypothetical protein
MKPIAIDLTMEQIEKVAPFLQKIAKMAKEGKPGMLVAQVFDDHMRLGIVDSEKATLLSKDPTKRVSFAPERYGSDD